MIPALEVLFGEREAILVKPEWSFSIDATDPVVTINEPVNGDFLYPPTQTVRWSIEEENLIEVTCTLNGTSHTILPGVFEDTVDLAEGLNVIEVAAMLASGKDIGVEDLPYRANAALQSMMKSLPE